MKTQNQMFGWCLLGLIASHCVLMTFAYPQQFSQQQISSYKQPQQHRFIPAAKADARKFAEKPNALKKVALDDIDDDIQTNQISDNGFSWSNMLGSMLMQMFFNGANGANANILPTKSDDVDNGVAPASSWANIISVGLKIITALLGGGNGGDGIDKVDNGNSPMQFISIVLNLLDALKTSFSHRSLNARSLGRKDSVADAAVASISMLKGYVKTYNNDDEKCMQKFLCEANEECSSDIGGHSIFCQLGSYAASFILERQTGRTFESLYDAGRKGRTGVDCKQIYLECNQV
ncbi:unnamed protein product [Chironomus riparius]|uniref:Secreted protein n=1 Tax=Chironomus riparius TaxID=315576 RepID=A0A9P0IUP1_9DIPT|nr:unnamed protein product [Chironomus riparius]